MFKVRLKNMRFFDRTFAILAPLARFYVGFYDERISSSCFINTGVDQ